MHRLRAILLFALLLLGACPSAWATIENLKSFKQAYPSRAPKASTCKVCHQNAIGRTDDLNAYGSALQALAAPADPKKLRVEDYRAVEADDADGDGAANGDELNAGTDPSDPASVPADTVKPSSLTPRELRHIRDYLADQLVPEAHAEEAAEYVGTESCAACHAKEAQEFQHSTHARISLPGELTVQGCEMCHGPGSLHVAAGGGRSGIVNPGKDPSACFTCHLDKQTEFRMTFHHPVLEGKMSCTDCHSPHGEDVRPWSATSLQDINEACFRCHKEQRGPFVWEHEAVREGCTTCHTVHGAIHDKLLLARDNTLCLRCHTQTNFPTIGKQGHGGRLPQGTCFSAGCHTAVHGSNFDDHLRY